MDWLRREIYLFCRRNRYMWGWAVYATAGVGWSGWVVVMTDQEINGAVARKLGVNRIIKSSEPSGILQWVEPVKDYCHSIEAAWEVVEWIHQNGGKLLWKPMFELSHSGNGWLCRMRQEPYEAADTAPMAICLAFLKLPWKSFALQVHRWRWAGISILKIIQPFYLMTDVAGKKTITGNTSPFEIRELRMGLKCGGRWMRPFGKLAGLTRSGYGAPSFALKRLNAWKNTGWAS